MQHLKRLAVSFFVFVFVVSLVLPALAVPSDQVATNANYATIMRSVRAVQADKGLLDKSFTKTLPLEDKTKQISKEKLPDALDEFISSEKDRLDDLNVPNKKQKAYVSFLKDELKTVDNRPPSFFEKMSTKVKGWFGSDSSTGSGNPAKSNALDIKIPAKPSRFNFSAPTVSVQSLKGVTVSPAEAAKVKKAKFTLSLANLFKVDTAIADNSYLPIAEDVQADDAEVVINQEILDLAESLGNNPVKISNYVRDHISYEPYYGAKKGSVGCLREAVCNDTDSASLTIALLRAAGIPAHYKKGVAVLTIASLKNLLGVQDPKAAYYALKANDVPVFTLSDNNPDLSSLQTADFSRETVLAIEWTFPEAYYDYDERGGNIGNTLNLSTVTSTVELQTLLGDSLYAKKQWIPIDTIVKPYTTTHATAVIDGIAWNTENFWTGFLSYQGTDSPMARFQSQLLSQYGRNMTAPAYQSSHVGQNKDFAILPITLPYILGAGQTANGTAINIESWSRLPDARRNQIKISLLNEAGQTEVLSHTFFASEVNNVPVTLSYAGATDTDKGVIESYGGIAATPAPLVDITPSFAVSANAYGTANTIAIGQPLILQFDYILNGSTVYTDQKFSVGGNEEGIYLTVSQIAVNAMLDDTTDPNHNSKILLDGNAALAREYLKHVNAQAQTLAKVLDHSAQTRFARAVVTQNRVLTKTGDGTPTTFDFNGLSIDATSYITHYSNGASYINHRKDFSLLYGEDASYYEGQLFTDVAGLSGVSTVKGLQYAYAHPETYTVHTITQANANEIDTLLLSENTKANLRADVAAGNTVVTPNKPIENGVFRGILYTSLKPDGTGTYAIGEQVGNGGYTVTGVDNIVIHRPDGSEFSRFKNQGSTNTFIFADGILSKDKTCSLSNVVFLSVLNDFGWKEEYGLPCLKETKQFGTVNHTYILATDGTKFTGSGYDYWIQENGVKQILENDKNKDNIDSLNNIKLNGTFKFSPEAGTYLWFGSSGFLTKDSFTMYYAPSPSNGGGHAVYGDILSKLSYNNNTVLLTLGFPVENRKNSHESFAGTDGKYQTFIGGQIYLKTSGFNKVYFIPGKIAEYYNSSENQLGTEKGTGGKFGFPISDPVFFSDVNEYIQKFEWKMIHYFTSNGSVGSVGYNDSDRRLNNRQFSANILQLVKDGKLTDVEAFSKISDYLSLVTDNNNQFAQDMMVIFIGSNGLVKSELVKALNKTKVYDGDSAPFHSLMVLGFSDTGFKFQYNDSHYCMDVATAGNYRCISNQLYHAMGGFGLAYFHGYLTGAMGTLYHDWNVNPLGFDGDSKEDVNLGLTMSQLGNGLMNGAITKHDIGNWILANLGESNYESKRISQTEVVRIGEFKKKFRIFEFMQNGNNENRWNYNEDVAVYKCNGKDLFYQNYSSFYSGGKDVGKAIAIWNKDQNKMVLLSGASLSQYPSMNNICLSLASLTGSYGVDLGISFNDMVNSLK